MFALVMTSFDHSLFCTFHHLDVCLDNRRRHGQSKFVIVSLDFVFFVVRVVWARRTEHPIQTACGLEQKP